MSIQVRVQTRKLEECVNYKNPSKIIQLKTEETDKDFLISQFREEVKSLPKGKLVKLKNQLLKTQVALASILAAVSPSIARAEEVSTNIQASSLGLPTPPEIMEFATMLIDYSIILGLAIGSVWLVISRLYYFHPKKNQNQKAMDAFSNTVKGMAQIIITPTIIRIILTLATILLGGSPAFHLPF